MWCRFLPEDKNVQGFDHRTVNLLYLVDLVEITHCQGMLKAHTLFPVSLGLCFLRPFLTGQIKRNMWPNLAELWHDGYILKLCQSLVKHSATHVRLRKAFTCRQLRKRVHHVLYAESCWTNVSLLMKLGHMLSCSGKSLLCFQRLSQCGYWRRGNDDWCAWQE